MTNLKIADSGPSLQANILVVEDDVIIRENLTEILSYEGFKVVAADGGISGLKMLKHQKPDLILCDIRMPDLDGYEVLNEVKKIYPDYEVPFVFLTALNEGKERRTAMEKGVCDFLTKPFKIHDLKSCINIQLEKSVAIKQRVIREVQRIESITGETIISQNGMIERYKEDIIRITARNNMLEKALEKKDCEEIDEMWSVITLKNAVNDAKNLIKGEIYKFEPKSQIYILLHRVLNRLTEKKVSQKNWALFQIYFDKVYRGFVNRIGVKFPGLTEAELTIVCAISLNLNNTHIADILKVQPESVRKSKYRIKKKMGLDASQSLRKYINSMKLEKTDIL
jgi:CheY-like chemotaxis protein